MRPPVSHPAFPPTKWALALLILVLWTVLLMRCSAATVVFGDPTRPYLSEFPFGTTTGGTAAYVGRFQQIYAGSSFPDKSLISQIAFSSGVVMISPAVNYVLSVGLGVTPRTPTNPGTGFASGASPLLSGAFVAHLTPVDGDWDLRIDMPTPFLYDSSLGNLLLDVTVNSVSGLPSMTTHHTSRLGTETVAMIYQGGTAVYVSPGQGEVTQFTVAPVPEPAAGALLFLGGALCIRRRLCCRAVALFTVVGSVFTGHSSASTIVVGETTHLRSQPFGTTDTGAAAYTGYYQQIYNKGYFDGESVISQIAFRSARVPLPIDRTYVLSLRLGVTSRTPMNLGSGFAGGTVPVFSGSATAHLTTLDDDWDFVIDLTTPFLYDVARGNLLLEIFVDPDTNKSATSPSIAFLGQGTTNAVGCIYSTGTSVVSQPGFGVTTRFIMNPVPEPATGALLLLGTALCIRRRGRARGGRERDSATLWCTPSETENNIIDNAEPISSASCMKTLRVPVVVLSLKCCLAILMWGVLAADTLATTIVAGQDRTQDVYPFGLYPAPGWGPPVYTDEYQQIYSSSLFPTAGWITQIAFMDAGLSLTSIVSWKF